MTTRNCWAMRPRAPITDAPMTVDPIPPARYPVPSAPGAVAALRATVPAKATPEQRDVPPPTDTEPPAEALEAVQVASEAFEALRRTGRELRFDTTENGVMRIKVYDGTGALVRSIPPNEALALASGEASWRA
jgi:uncharacterized FlaG/YvyC family protein